MHVRTCGFCHIAFGTNIWHFNEYAKPLHVWFAIFPRKLFHWHIFRHFEILELHFENLDRNLNEKYVKNEVNLENLSSKLLS